MFHRNVKIKIPILYKTNYIKIKLQQLYII